MTHFPLRLRIDGQALVSNWRWLAGRSGPAACGAAVKANGYGTGAGEVVTLLRAAGCRDFFVATWNEAEAVLPLIGDASLSVLHGVQEEDMSGALASAARPVLNTPLQVRRWREAAGGRACDVMLDTGMNRLGLTEADVATGLLDGLAIDTLMSHLACADEDSAMNERQRGRFAALAGSIPARRRSLANSAGICLGADYGFDLTRPGIALYGGIPRPEAQGIIRQVVRLEAQIIQRRRADAGESVGYNATFTAERPVELAVLNIGYADGYLRGFSGRGRALAEGAVLPVIGRVSMDLTTIGVDAAPHLREGDWVALDYDLAAAAAQSGLSQYELLTILGRRHQRLWT
ncbi:alanine racemase [Sphingosinicella sp. BN140058]|uniref:alanine racemase n=1 Tax=Sphingosinicella sp. BN140058 TaxID=1892855 RepID=UPI00101247D0|nr:alanine racemase [Sphingosinicella sp. BN140058]QAY75536.1 alanine racemase [Sphingosinicella sp. BN140058]